MDHLLFLGHRRIAMIDAIDPNAQEWPVDGRARAYTAGLERAGIPLDLSLFDRNDWGADAGAEAMERLLSLPEPPTAVLAHSDEVAFGVLRTLRRAGIRVPEQVSVIGIDDHPVAAQLDLTTVHQDVRLQGEMVARMIVGILAGETAGEAVLLPTHLVPRGSTGPPSR
jgi:DNA-binding LacI/PurR family transcriptional regulator